jgi:hypothetical protein
VCVCLCECEVERDSARDALISAYELFQQNNMIHVQIFIELPTYVFQPYCGLDHIHRPRDTNCTCGLICSAIHIASCMSVQVEPVSNAVSSSSAANTFYLNATYIIYF